MTAQTGARASAMAFALDGERRVVESSGTAPAVGDVVVPGTWLGNAVLGAAADAFAAPGSEWSRTATDSAAGTHWLIVASADGGGRARVTVVDVTAAIAADRCALLQKVLHSLNNTTFATRSVLEAIAAEHPRGEALDDYLRHLKGPADRLAALATRLENCLVLPPLGALAPLRVDALIAQAVARAGARGKPASVAVAEPSLVVAADAERLAEAVAALLDSGDGGASALLVERSAEAGRAAARIVVERPCELADAGAVAAFWDLASGRSLEAQSRLALARAVVRAHGGDVWAEASAPGRIRVGVRVPLVTAE